MAAILNFSQKSRNTKMLVYLKPSDFGKFFYPRVSVKTSLSKFQQISHSPKMAAILNFQIFFKNAKHKNTCISKTVLHTVISTKFLTHRVTLLSGLPSFQKHFILSKMVAILNFLQKLQNTKNACISKTVRQSNFAQIFYPQGVCEDWPFQVLKNFSLSKNGGHCQFSNL